MKILRARVTEFVHETRSAGIIRKLDGGWSASSLCWARWILEKRAFVFPILILTVAVASLGMGVSGSVANAADAQKKITESFELKYNPQIENRGLVTATAKLPKKFTPKLIGNIWSDGSWSIEGKGEYESGRPCFSIEYVVDKKQKSFSINPIANHGLDDSYLQLQASNSSVNPEALPSDAVASSSNTRCEVPTDAAAPTEFQAQAIPGIFTGYASVRTRDLPDWTITKTSDQLKWYVGSNLT